MKIATAIIIFGAIVAGLVILGSRSGAGQGAGPADNVTIEGGAQIVEISARGGYQPRLSQAKAGLPTIIRFKTNGSFDCSSSVRIPDLNISKLLPQTGTTDIDVGTPKPGPLLGSCGMGMYRFEVDFNS